MHNSVLAVILQKLKMAETHDQGSEDKGPKDRFCGRNKQTKRNETQRNATKLLPQIFCHIKNVGSSHRKVFSFGHNKRPPGPTKVLLLLYVYYFLSLFFLGFSRVPSPIVLRQKACKVVKEILRIAGDTSSISSFYIETHRGVPSNKQTLESALSSMRLGTKHLHYIWFL